MLPQSGNGDWETLINNQILLMFESITVMEYSLEEVERYEFPNSVSKRFLIKSKWIL